MINSVLQYTVEPGELGSVLGLAARALADDGRGILAVDVPLDRVHPLRDFVDLVRFLRGTLTLVEVVDLLVRSARHRPRRARPIPTASIRSNAAALGFDVEILPSNLSGLRSRSSVLLVPASRPPAPRTD